MKQKDREALRVMSVDELKSEIEKRRRELFKIKFQKAFKEDKNSLRQRYLRREIAALTTWSAEKTRQAAS